MDVIDVIMDPRKPLWHFFIIRYPAGVAKAVLEEYLKSGCVLPESIYVNGNTYTPHRDFYEECEKFKKRKRLCF